MSRRRLPYTVQRATSPILDTGQSPGLRDSLLLSDPLRSSFRSRSARFVASSGRRLPGIQALHASWHERFEWEALAAAAPGLMSLTSRDF